MTRRYTALVSTVLIGLFWPAFTSNAQAAELNLFAGPQSVMPREIVHVTVQSFVEGPPIKLSYNFDGETKTLIGETENGLVSFEISAQETVGQMRFTAKADVNVSNTAFVFVHAGPPQNFTMDVVRGKQARTVDISSGVITDGLGNPISDLALVSLDWTDDKGLITRKNIHLEQGRIVLRAECPREFTGSLKLRAAVNTASSTSSDISSLCREKTHLGRR